MIKVTTIEPFKKIEYEEKYSCIEEFIMVLSDMQQEFDVEITIKFQRDEGEGMFYITDHNENPISAGLIEEIKNKKRKTVKEYLKSIF